MCDGMEKGEAFRHVLQEVGIVNTHRGAQE